MDAAAAVAVGLVALGLVLGAAAWRHVRGGIRVDLRVWWDSVDDDRDSGPDDDGGPGPVP